MKINERINSIIERDELFSIIICTDNIKKSRKISNSINENVIGFNREVSNYFYSKMRQGQILVVSGREPEAFVGYLSNAKYHIILDKSAVFDNRCMAAIESYGAEITVCDAN